MEQELWEKAQLLLKNQTIICVGDVILDEFSYGSVDRISRESPVPILVQKYKRYYLGGVGNAAANAKLAGCNVKCIGVRGEDEEGQIISNLFKEKNIEYIPCYVKQTLVKKRYLCNNQQLLRVDSPSDEDNMPAVREEALLQLEKSLPKAAAVIMSDYDNLLINKDFSARVIALAHKHQKPLFIDPRKKDVTIYKNAFCLKPNLKELGDLCDYNFPNNCPLDVIYSHADKLRQKANLQYMIVTLSERGMLLIDNQSYEHIQNNTSPQVFDVSGAGDTVIAYLAALCTVSANMKFNCKIANIAANIAVVQHGTVPVSAAEVNDFILKGNNGNISGTIYQLKDLKQKTSQLKTMGKIVGFTNGCFDLIHQGHISVITAARAECDFLIVAVNSDSSVKQLKGDSRPIQGQDSRLAIVSSIKGVDAAILFTEHTADNIISILQPDIVVKGGDYDENLLPEANTVKKYGGKIKIISFVGQNSTTGIINKITSQKQ